MRILLVCLLAAGLGVSCAAAADTVLRYRPLVRNTDDLAAMAERRPAGWDDYALCGPCGYPVDIWSPIVPAPPLVAPPVAVVPFLGRPVAPLPMRIYRRRDGTWVREPDPHFQYFYIPRYPHIVTAGSAYYPTPEYPNYGRTRVDVRFYRVR